MMEGGAHAPTVKLTEGIVFDPLRSVFESAKHCIVGEGGPKIARCCLDRKNDILRDAIDHFRQAFMVFRSVNEISDRQLLPMRFHGIV